MTQPTVGWSLAELRARFLAIRERIEMHARIYFRHIRCWFKKDDLIAETIALAWKWFRRLAAKGKDAREFASVLASYAARAVKCGRRITRQLNAKDVLSEQAQQRHGFYVGKIPDFSTLDTNPLQEALIDNTRSPVPEQVSFASTSPPGSAPVLTATVASSATWRWASAPSTCREGTAYRLAESASSAASSTTIGNASAASSTTDTSSLRSGVRAWP